MSEADEVFAGAVPEIYDRYMVPLIFQLYATDIARRAAWLSPSAILEIAAGTGVVTRALAPKLHPSVSYVVTDLNQDMLNYAASLQVRRSAQRWEVKTSLPRRGQIRSKPSRQVAQEQDLGRASLALEPRSPTKAAELEDLQVRPQVEEQEGDREPLPTRVRS